MKHDFKNYFLPPYKAYGGTIMDGDSNYALTVDMYYPDELADSIVDALNDKPHESFNYYIKDGYNFFDNDDDKYVMCVRSWGRLTGSGHGALGLPSDEAKQIQDDFAQWVLEKLNNEVEDD